MYPVLFDVFGVSITGYGVSKALAVLAAAFLLTASSAGWVDWYNERRAPAVRPTGVVSRWSTSPAASRSSMPWPPWQRPCERPSAAGDLARSRPTG